MAVAEGLALDLQMTLKFFKTTLSVFEEGDSGFAPSPELYTVAGHVSHAADTVDWLTDRGLQVLPNHPVKTGGHEPYRERRYQWAKDAGRAIRD